MRFTYKTFTIIWTVFIAVLSFTPGNYLPNLEWKLLSPDTVAHIVFYAVLAFPLTKWLQQIGFNNAKSYIHGFLISFSYGLIIELMQQNLIPGRFFDVFDLLSNGIGIVLGISIVFFKK